MSRNSKRWGEEVQAILAAVDNGPQEMKHGDTVRLLARAGAHVTRADVEGWSEDERNAARTWALAQIDADKQATPQQRISVRWPDHVSAAHHRHAQRKAQR